MATRGGGPAGMTTRMDQAKRAAQNVVSQLSPGADAIVIEGGREARVVAPLDRDPRRLPAAIATVAVRDVEGDLAGALARSRTDDLRRAVTTVGPHRDDMAMRLALSNTAESVMSSAGPLAGGLIAASLGYHTVFAVLAVCQTVALLLLLRFVEEPRKQRLALDAEKELALGASSTTGLAERDAEEGGA